MAYVSNNKNWSYKDILDTDDTHHNGLDDLDTKNLIGLNMDSISSPYVDLSNMDLDQMIQSSTHTCSKTVTYLNLSRNSNIYIKDKNNHIAVVSPITNIHSFSKEELDPPDEFIIVEEYRYGSIKAAIEMLHITSLLDGISPNDVHKADRIAIQNDVREAIRLLTKKSASIYNAVNQSIRLRFMRSVPIEAINRAEILHIVNADIIVSTDRAMCLGDYPSKSREVSVVECETGYTVQIEIIDNDNALSDKYTKLIDRVVKLPVTKRPNIPDGLSIKEYMNSKLVYESNCDLTESNLSRYGIYNSKEAAMSHNDSKLMEAAEKYKELLRLLKDKEKGLAASLENMVPPFDTETKTDLISNLDKVNGIMTTLTKAANLAAMFGKLKK